MKTKSIASTDAQNNFGRILDDVVQNQARYIIKRRSSSQAILLSLAEFERLLDAAESERQKMGAMIRELSPTYDLGQPVEA